MDYLDHIILRDLFEIVRFMKVFLDIHIVLLAFRTTLWNFRNVLVTLNAFFNFITWQRNSYDLSQDMDQTSVRQIPHIILIIHALTIQDIEQISSSLTGSYLSTFAIPSVILYIPST